MPVNDPAAFALITASKSPTPRPIRRPSKPSGVPYVRNSDEALWARERARIVLEETLRKFRATSSSNGENGGMRRWLVEETGEREIVEASPRDRGRSSVEAGRAGATQRWGTRQRMEGREEVRLGERNRTPQVEAGQWRMRVETGHDRGADDRVHYG